MKETKLIAGHEGLSNNIKWVTVIEIVEDIGRLQQGEFLITTGFNLLEDETRLENFHRLLKANLLSGVAIYTSFYMSEIPDSFIKLAHEQHLPLIEIPVDINFSEITKEILAQLVNQQAHILTQSEIIHHELTKLVLNDKSLQEVTKRLAQLTSSQIVIYNQFYDIMYHNQDFHPTEELFFSNTILTHHNQSVDLSNDLLRSLDKESKVNIMLDASIVTVYPIIAKQSCFGWIVLFKSKATWNEIDDIAIGRASTIYAMEFLKKQAVEETRIRMQSSLLEDIIHVTKDNQDLVTEQILKLDYDITKQQSVLSITCKQEGMLDFQMMDRLYYLIENICMQKNKQHIIQAKAQSIVLLTNVIGESEEEQYQHLQQLAQEIIETWEFYFPKINLMIGIGNCYDDLFEISLSAQQANYALKLYPLIDDAIQIIHYEDLGMYDFLLNMLHHGMDLKTVYQNNIRGLFHDKEREIDLIETIYIYFKNNQSIQQSADQLFIHRHTFRYRLKQVEKITGLNLKETDDLLKLQIGIMAFKMVSILQPE